MRLFTPERLARPALLLATIIWGGAFVVMKNTLGFIEPSTLLAFRFLGAFTILAPVCLFTKKFRLLNRDYLIGSAVLGVLIFLAFYVQTLGLQRTTPGKNAFLTAIYCVIVPFMAWFAAGQRPDRYNLMAALFCIAGVGLVSLTGGLGFGSGDGLSALSGLLFAAQITLTAVYTKGRDVLLITCLQFLAAGLLALVFAIGFEPPPAAIPSSAVFGLLYLCLMSTALAMLCQSFGQKYTPASAASLLLSLEAVFGLIFSVIFYAEELSPRLLFGFGLIFAAIIISETKLSFLSIRGLEGTADPLKAPCTETEPESP